MHRDRSNRVALALLVMPLSLTLAIMTRAQEPAKKGTSPADPGAPRVVGSRTQEEPDKEQPAEPAADRSETDADGQPTGGAASTAAGESSGAFGGGGVLGGANPQEGSAGGSFPAGGLGGSSLGTGGIGRGKQPTGGFGGMIGLGTGQYGPGYSRLVDGGAVMISWSKEKDELYGFSRNTGEWSQLKIARQEKIVPVVGNEVAAVRVGDTMAAFSAVTGSWDILQLSSGSRAVPVVGQAVVQTTDNGRFYTFGAAKGRWTSPNDPALGSPTKPMSPASNAAPGRRSSAPGLDLPELASRPQRRPADHKAIQLARQYQGKGLDNPQARGAVSRAVAEAFDERQAAQQAEALRLAEKLDEIRSALRRRAALRERIIERRVDELLDPDIDWDALPAGPNRPATDAKPSLK